MARKSKPQTLRKLGRKIVRLMPMRVLRINDDDVLVLQTDLMLDQEEATYLRQYAEREFGEKHKIVVLTAGLKLGVLRNEKDESKKDRRGAYT
jgi:hypothetical protein